jgi:hypothetical protein
VVVVVVMGFRRLMKNLGAWGAPIRLGSEDAWPLSAQIIARVGIANAQPHHTSPSDINRFAEREGELRRFGMEMEMEMGTRARPERRQEG